MQRHRMTGSTGSAQVFQMEGAPVCTTCEGLFLQGALENILREKEMPQDPFVQKAGYSRGVNHYIS